MSQSQPSPDVSMPEAGGVATAAAAAASTPPPESASVVPPPAAPAAPPTTAAYGSQSTSLPTPGRTPSLSELGEPVEPDLPGPATATGPPLAGPTPTADPPAVAVPPPPPPGQAAAGPSIAVATTAALARLSALEDHLLTARQRGDDRAGQSILLQMEDVAHEAWLTDVYESDCPTDAYYFLLLAVLFLINGDLPSAVSLLNAGKPALKAHPLALPLATLVSGAHEGVPAAIWASRSSLLLTLGASPPADQVDGAFRSLLTTLLDIFVDGYRQDTVARVAKVYTAIPLGELAALLGMTEVETAPVVPRLGWRLDESTTLVTPVRSSPTQSLPSTQRHFASLARRVLALEQTIRVD